MRIWERPAALILTVLALALMVAGQAVGEVQALLLAALVLAVLARR